MSSAIHAASGSAAGILAMTLTYPLIFISTRAAVQVQKEHKSTVDAVLDIVKSEGLLGLYSGLTGSLLGIGVTNGVYYYFYEKSREIIIRSKPASAFKGLSTLEAMLAGLIAGSATSVISNPLWVVQTTQSVRTLEHPPNKAGSSSDGKPIAKKLGFAQTVMHILRKDGVGAFWRGIGPALVLVVNPIIQYTVFEKLKNTLIARRTAKLRAGAGAASAAASAVAVLSDLDYFFLGALSKLVATSISYPYIVIKSRLQAGHAKYTSAVDGILTVVQNEGISGLYKGIGAKLVQSVLTAAILFAGQKRIYEITKNALAVAKA